MEHPHRSRRFRRLLGAAVATAIATAGLVHGAAPAGAVDSVVSIGDASITEGDSGTRIIRLMVTLDTPAAVAVVANFATMNGTATRDLDYKAKAHRVRFNPGQTTKYAKVIVKPDGLTEGNEQFSVLITSVTGAVVGDGTGQATIVDAETATGAQVSIGNASVTEGTDGSSRYVFLAMSLNQPAGTTASITFTTGGGSASVPGDYLSRTATITFGAKTRVMYALVYLVGDVADDGDKTFDVTLSDPVNLTIGDGTGTVTIVDDD